MNYDESVVVVYDSGFVCHVEEASLRTVDDDVNRTVERDANERHVVPERIF